MARNGPVSETWTRKIRSAAATGAAASELVRPHQERELRRSDVAQRDVLVVPEGNPGEEATVGGLVQVLAPLACSRFTFGSSPPVPPVRTDGTVVSGSCAPNLLDPAAIRQHRLCEQDLPLRESCLTRTPAVGEPNHVLA